MASPGRSLACVFLCLWGFASCRPQGPMGSSIPFFYVSGNPFRDVLLQHQLVREQGLHGWVYVNTPPLADDKQEQREELQQEASDVPELPSPSRLTEEKQELVLQSDVQTPLEEVRSTTMDDDDAVEGRRVVPAPALDEGDADDHVDADIEIIELTARHDVEHGGTVVPLLLLEEAEDALLEDGEEVEENEIEDVAEEEVFDDVDDGEDASEFQDVSDLDGPLTTTTERVTTTTTEEVTTSEVPEPVTSTLPNVQEVTAPAIRPLVPPRDDFVAADDQQQQSRRQPKRQRGDPLLKLRPSDKDPLLGVRQNFLPHSSFFDFNRPIPMQLADNHDDTSDDDAAVLRGEIPASVVRLIRVGPAGVDVDPARRRFVGTINAEGPPFFLNFRILPVGHSFDYDLLSSSGEEEATVDIEQVQNSPSSEAAPVVAEVSTEQVPAEVEDVSTEASLTESLEVAAAPFDLIEEQESESGEEEDGGDSRVDVRSLEDDAAARPPANRLEDDRPPAFKRRQQVFGQRTRQLGRRPKVIADSPRGASAAVASNDDGAVVFQPSMLESEGFSSKASSKFSCNGRSFGYFPHASDCRRYHVCLPHRAGGYRHWNFRCGPGTVFSVKHQACVHEDRVSGQC